MLECSVLPSHAFFPVFINANHVLFEVDDCSVDFNDIVITIICKVIENHKFCTKNFDETAVISYEES